MPLLETRHVKSTRKDRYCEECQRPMPKGSKAVAMYGMAHDGEKPWWMYVHPRGGCPWPTQTPVDLAAGVSPTEGAVK